MTPLPALHRTCDASPIIDYPTGSSAWLAVIASVLAAATVTGAMLARRRAPAVSIGLAGGLLVGIVGFFVASIDGPHGVPQEVGIWASIGLAECGLLGSALMPARPPARPLWRAALLVALTAPLAATALRFAVGAACPLYVTRGARRCFYDVDLLGGWAAAVTVMLAGDLLGIAFLLGVSAWQARGLERA